MARVRGRAGTTRPGSSAGARGSAGARLSPWCSAVRPHCPDHPVADNSSPTTSVRAGAPSRLRRDAQLRPQRPVATRGPLKGSGAKPAQNYMAVVCGFDGLWKSALKLVQAGTQTRRAHLDDRKARVSPPWHSAGAVGPTHHLDGVDIRPIPALHGVDRHQRSWQRRQPQLRLVEEQALFVVPYGGYDVINALEVSSRTSTRPSAMVHPPSKSFWRRLPSPIPTSSTGSWRPVARRRRRAPQAAALGPGNQTAPRRDPRFWRGSANPHRMSRSFMSATNHGASVR